MNINTEFKNYTTKHLGMGSLKFDALMNHQTKNITPYILEERALNVTQMDIFSRMLGDRIIFLNEQVDDHSMGIINAQMLFLANLDSNTDIQLYLNSPGGSVISGLSLYDTMNYINPDVSTTTMGMAASMGAILASSGTKGKRSILKHSRFMIHDIRGGNQGTYLDMKTSLELSQELRYELFTILANNSGNSYEQIEEWCNRDKWIKSDDAVSLGFMDKIV